MTRKQMHIDMTYRIISLLAAAVIFVSCGLHNPFGTETIADPGYINGTNSPGIPQNVHASVDGSQYAIDITWDATSNCSSYKLFRSNRYSTNCQYIASMGAYASPSYSDAYDCPIVPWITNSYYIMGYAYPLSSRLSIPASAPVGYSLMSNISGATSWISNSIVINQFQWYYFPGTAGSNYALYIDDRYGSTNASGATNYTADIYVYVFGESNAFYYSSIDSPYVAPITISALRNERVYLRVRCYSSGSGTYAIRISNI
ncbi:MAG: hypothetical protein HZC28_20615 [Spirochaetes bacterium]|nr:hypothetical protein [Spirochaetota bacterium]